MGKMIRFILTLFLVHGIGCSAAFAGFQGFNGNTDHGVFSRLKCDTGGLSCTDEGQEFQIAVSALSGIVQNRVVTSTSTTLSSSQCGSTVISQSSALTVTFPEASANLGCRFSVVVGASTTLTLDLDDNDQFLVLTDSTGDSLTNGTKGNSVVFEAIDDSSWAPISAEKGTWTDAN